MLIISSLDGVANAYETHKPARVISLLSEDEALPAFEGLDPARHLKLYVERDACSLTISNAARRRAEEIVAFLRAWDRTGDILIHCNLGVSRSMAAGFITLCLFRNDDEAAIAQELRNAAPHADPCPLIVAYADDLLSRDGRMLDAIEDLPPPCSATGAPVLTLPLETSAAK